MCKKVLLKFIAITLITSLNWLGFWGVIRAGAFFSDNESSKLSIFSTAYLDFSLASDSDFSDKVDPQSAVKRSIRIINEGNMNLNYDIGIAFMNGLDDFCEVLDLEFYRNNLLLFSGSLKNFNLNNAKLATGTIDVLDLFITLNSSLNIYQEKSCEFDFIFEGEQVSGAGFSDIEKISNLVISSTWENIADHLVINKVCYDVAPDQIGKERNEWIELYNPTESSINLKKWQICNQGKCVKINSNTSIEANKYILISHDNSTWRHWEVPDDVQTINALGGRFALNNISDMLILKDAEGNIIDQMNWGVPNINWTNYNADIWNPGVVDAPEGRILGRVPSGQDTDTAADWQYLSLIDLSILSADEEDGQSFEMDLDTKNDGEETMGGEEMLDGEEISENDAEEKLAEEEDATDELDLIDEKNPDIETDTAEGEIENKAFETSTAESEIENDSTETTVVDEEIENDSTETEEVLGDTSEEMKTDQKDDNEDSPENGKKPESQGETAINEDEFETQQNLTSNTQE